VTTVYICERTALHGCVGYVKYVIDVLGLTKSIQSENMDIFGKRAPKTQRLSAEDHTGSCNMDPSPIFRAGAFLTSVAGAEHSHPGLFSCSTPYTPNRVSFFYVRARYGARFERAMRMYDDAFNGLVSVLRPRFSHRGLCAEARTAIALRYLGSGSYIDICAAFGVHTATVYRSLWDVVDAVNSSPALALDFQLADSTRRQAYAARFQSRRNFPFGNVVGALDGIAVEQEQPLASDVTCVADNNFLKGFYAFNVQAICDAEYKFRWMSCKSPGAMYDSAAFTCTSLGQSLSRPDDPLTSSLIRDGQCIAANETYARARYWVSRGPARERVTFGGTLTTFMLSSLRIHIEQAFGMLVWRWGVFWRPIRVPFAKRPSLMRACFRLHNFCRDHATDGTNFVAPFGDDRIGGNVFFSHNDAVSTDQRGGRRDRERSAFRVKMTGRVEELGLLRPGVAPLY